MSDGCAAFRSVVGAEGVDVAADREASVGGEPDLVGRGLGVLGEAGVRHEDLGFAVLHDVRDLGPDEVPVDRDEVEAGLADREEQLEHLGAVRQQHRDRVAALEAQGAESVYQLVARGQQLSGGDLALVGIDEREVVGERLGDLPESERRRVGGRGGHRASVAPGRGTERVDDGAGARRPPPTGRRRGGTGCGGR